MIFNNKIIDFFRHQDRISALRLYIYISNKLSGHLHTSQFQQIREDLLISDPVIQKSVRQMLQMGVIQKYSKGHYRLISWKKWAGYENIRRAKTFNISLEQLRDLKFLRTFYYAIKFQNSYKLSKKNSKDKKKSTLARDIYEAARSHKGYFPVSGSFVKKTNQSPFSESTFSRHLNRAKSRGLIKVKHLYQKITQEPTIGALQELKKIAGRNTFIKKEKLGYSLNYRMPNVIQPLMKDYSSLYRIL